MLVVPAIDLLGGKVVRLVEGRRDRTTVLLGPAWRGGARFRRRWSDPRARRRSRRRVLRAARQRAGGQSHRRRRGARPTRRRRARPGHRRTPARRRGRLAGARHALCQTARGDGSHLRPLPWADSGRGRRPRRPRRHRGLDRGHRRQRRRARRSLCRDGAAAILYTDIARDGTGSGPNVDATVRLQRALAPLSVFASGGVGSLDHLRALAHAGVAAAIVGRALYDPRLHPRRGVAAMSRLLQPTRSEQFQGRKAAVGRESGRGEARRALLDEGGLPPSIEASAARSGTLRVRH